MRQLRSVLPTRWWSRLLWVFVSYIFAADFLPNLLMLIVNCSGYLPYSDRPGPGWQPPHWPQATELNFFFGFALYMGIPTLLYSAGQTLLAFIYEICSLPKWLIQICGGVSGVLAAGLLMMGAGWMIAIAPIGIYMAAACGFFWGIFVLPVFIDPRGNRLPLWMRTALPLVSVSVGVLYLIYPLIPKTPIPSITFELNRVINGPQLVRADATPYLKPETQSEIDGLHLRGELHGGVQSSQGSGNHNAVDVVVLALQPIDHEYKVEVPAEGHVVYVLAEDKLTPHPAFNKKDKREVLIEPGIDKAYDGGRIKVGNKGGFTAFTWYPTILR